MAVKKEYAKTNLLNIELRRIRCCLVEILSEIEDMNLRIIPLIQGEFAAQIGIWLLEEAQVSFQLCEAREKKSMLQAKVSHKEKYGEPCSNKSDEGKLDRLNRMLCSNSRSVSQSISTADALASISEEDLRKMKACMRALTWRFHPDLHKCDSFSDAIFSSARKAYAQGDVETLQCIERDSRIKCCMNAEENSDSLLLADIELANAQVSFYADKLASIMQSEPFLLKRMLQDCDWVDQQVLSIQARIFAMRHRLAECQMQVDDLLAS